MTSTGLASLPAPWFKLLSVRLLEPMCECSVCNASGSADPKGSALTEDVDVAATAIGQEPSVERPWKAGAACMLCSGLDWRAGECVSPGLRSNTQFVKRAVLWTAFLYPVPRGEISKVVCETRNVPPAI